MEPIALFWITGPFLDQCTPLSDKRCGNKTCVTDVLKANTCSRLTSPLSEVVGVAMFLEEERLALSGDVSEYDEKKYEKAYEALRDNRSCQTTFRHRTGIHHLLLHFDA